MTETTGNQDPLISNRLSEEPIDGDGVETPHIAWHQKLRNKLNPRYVYALADQGVVSLGNLVLYAAVKRHCSFAEYGIFYLALRSLDILNQLCNVLIWGPLTFNLAAIRSDDRYKKYLGSNVAHQLVASTLAIVILLALAGVSRLHGPGTTYDHLFLPLVAPSIFIIFREFIRRIYFAQMRFAEALFTDTFTVILQIGVIFYFIHRGEVSYPHALWALSSGCVFLVLYAFLRERRELRFNLADIRSDFKLNLELGRWFFGTNMLFVASSQANPWILNSFLGPGAVGAYGLCEQVINFPRVAITSMQNAMAPSMAVAFADGGKSALRRVVRRMDGILISGTALMFGVIIWLGPWVQRVIFHSSTPNARLILGLLAFNLVAYAAALAQSYGLTALNRPSLNFYAGIIGLAGQLALALVLVHPFGIPGVAVSFVCGSIIVLIARIFYYMREMNRP